MAPLTAPADRLGNLRHVLTNEAEPLVGLTQLLRLCRDEHPTLWEHRADPRCRARIATLLTRVVEALPDAGTESAVAPRVRKALAAALTHIPDTPAVAVAHALAELLDTHYGHCFTDWFRHRSPYQPAVGDPIPLDSPDLRRITDLSPTAAPWRLANRLDETRRVRLAGAWTTQFRVVFDYSAFDALAGLITAHTVLVTCHPNHDLTEFDLPRDRRDPAFPIRPTDLDAQRDRINGLLSEATGAGAQVVVLPELCVTEELAFELEAWVRRPGPDTAPGGRQLPPRRRHPSGSSRQPGPGLGARASGTAYLRQALPRGPPRDRRHHPAWMARATGLRDRRRLAPRDRHLPRPAEPPRRARPHRNRRQPGTRALDERNAPLLRWSRRPLVGQAGQ